MAVWRAIAVRIQQGPTCHRFKCRAGEHLLAANASASFGRSTDRRLAIMIAEGTLVEDCLELPQPAANRTLVAQVEGLGITLPVEPSGPECVFEVLPLVHRESKGRFDRLPHRR